MNYVEAYNICKKEIDFEELIPNLQDNEIIKLISREDWLMFKLSNELDKDEAKLVARPNIYLRLKDDKFNMGLTLNQIGAVRWFLEICQPYNIQKKTEMLELLHNLPDGYNTDVERKIKDKYYAQVPKYIEEDSFKTNTLTFEELDKLCKKAEQIEKEGKQKTLMADKYYAEFPAIHLAFIENLDLTEQNLRNAAKTLFPLLQKCLSIEQRKKVPENIKQIIEKIYLVKDWWHYIYYPDQRNDLISKLTPNPTQEDLKKAINIIKKSEEYKLKKEEHFI